MLSVFIMDTPIRSTSLLPGVTARVWARRPKTGPAQGLVPQTVSTQQLPLGYGYELRGSGSKYHDFNWYPVPVPGDVRCGRLRDNGYPNQAFDTRSYASGLCSTDEDCVHEGMVCLADGTYAADGRANEYCLLGGGDFCLIDSACYSGSCTKRYLRLFRLKGTTLRRGKKVGKKTS